MNQQAWTVAVMGAGALGGYFGARLMQAGHTVHFIARGRTLDALRTQGIRLIQDDGEYTQHPVSATDRPDTIGTVDLLLFATKGQHLEQAVPAARPLVADMTVVLPILNGIDISERIAAGLGRGIVLGGLTRVIARSQEPGVVVQTGEARPLVLGALTPTQEPVARETARRLLDAGVNATCSEAIRTDIWLKFIGWSAFAGAQCTSGLPAGEITGHPEAGATFDDIVRECEALAAATGVPLPPGLVERLHRSLATFPPDTTVSMFDDLRAGRPLELETTLGALVALGERLGIPTPAARRAYEAMRPFINGAL